MGWLFKLKLDSADKIEVQEPQLEPQVIANVELTPEQTLKAAQLYDEYKKSGDREPHFRYWQHIEESVGYKHGPGTILEVLRYSPTCWKVEVTDYDRQGYPNWDE